MFFQAIFRLIGQQDAGTSFAARAQASMREVQIQTFFWDIFDRREIDYCKSFFSPLLNAAPPVLGPEETTGMEEYELQYRETDLGYLVDKSLSSRVSTEFVEAIIQGIEPQHEEELRRIRARIPPDNAEFFIGAVEKSEPNRKTPQVCYSPTFVELEFMYRVVIRLDIQESQKLFAELERPVFSVEENNKYLEREITSSDSSFSRFVNENRPSFTQEDRDAFLQYVETFFTTRNIRIMTFLKEAWAKDKAARAIDPQAPLTNLVMIEQHEKSIYEKRKWLYMKTVAGAVVSIVLFFLQKGSTFCGELGDKVKRQLLIGHLFWKGVGRLRLVRVVAQLLPSKMAGQPRL